MHIEITLTEDEEAAMQKRLGASTPEEFCVAAIKEQLARYVKEDYDAEVQRIGAAAAALPRSARLAIIQQLDATLNP